MYQPNISYVCPPPKNITDGSLLSKQETVTRDSIRLAYTHYAHTLNTCQSLVEFAQKNVSAPFRPEHLSRYVRTLNDSKGSLIIAIKAMKKNERTYEWTYQCRCFPCPQYNISSSHTPSFECDFEKAYAPECRYQQSLSANSSWEEMEAQLKAGNPFVGDHTSTGPETNSTRWESHGWWPTPEHEEVSEIMKSYYRRTAGSCNDIAQFEGVPINEWPRLLPELVEILKNTKTLTMEAIRALEPRVGVSGHSISESKRFWRDDLKTTVAECRCPFGRIYGYE
ncbi:hypothetical protein BT63DRAFT_422239 [Microthyrium microscopicum]|uniref:MAM domain-containing protein n=1 Tax=Microthyrium microscopicum TaxID=703497 RepID=A0A6A6UJK1_9PEZI|nr:hypothetical protein BT63DRAFT_422239 [Microthyrium microscopicum]